MLRAPAHQLVASFGLLGFAVIALVSSCSVGDTECPDNWDVNDLNDACPYGPPGGPQKDKSASLCPEIVFDKKDCAGVSFEDYVFPIIAKGGSGNCTAGGCHATAQDAANARDLRFPPDGLTALYVYNTLQMYTDPQGDPFWDAGNTKAWVLCNILAEPGGGSPMPKPGGLQNHDDQVKITKWVTCGMPKPGTVTSSDGGAGGTGGSGAGGAGVGGAGGSK